MKRQISLLLVLFLLVSALTPAALAASDTAAEDPSVPVSPAETAAEALATIGVFRGTGSGFALDRAPTRTEAAAMLVRLYGAEDEAQGAFENGQISHPFTDVSGWAEPYVAWLYANELTRGVGPETFGAARSCSAKDYAVFLLRALGYADGEDFTYADALDFAAEHGVYTEGLFSGTFTRGDLALMTWFALFCQCREGGTTLLQSLVKRGAVDTAAAQKLQTQYQADGLALSKDGLLITNAKWQSALKDLTLTVHLASNSPTLAGDTVTLDAEALSPLAEDAGSGRVCIPTTSLRALADGWGERFAAKSGPFLFESYVKGWAEIDFLTCDYRLDTDAAVKALLFRLLTLQSGEIDAPLRCYRNGKPFSLGDTYVEVDFDNQQLTFFKDGQMVLNSNVVTGKLDGHQTPKGLYYSHNKLRSCVLTGPDFQVFVKYWISIIYDVIGFHDASWRSYFGGEDYVNNGSHGCINTPEPAMAYLFEHLDDGTPVLMYGRNTWYDVNDPAASPVTKDPVHGQTAK